MGASLQTKTGKYGYGTEFELEGILGTAVFGLSKCSFDRCRSAQVCIAVNCSGKWSESAGQNSVYLHPSETILTSAFRGEIVASATASRGQM